MNHTCGHPVQEGGTQGPRRMCSKCWVAYSSIWNHSGAIKKSPSGSDVRKAVATAYMKVLGPIVESVRQELVRRSEMGEEMESCKELLKKMQGVEDSLSDAMSGRETPQAHHAINTSGPKGLERKKR